MPRPPDHGSHSIDAFSDRLANPAIRMPRPRLAHTGPRFAKITRISVRHAVLALIFLPGLAAAQDNSAAYQALNHGTIDGPHKHESAKDAKIHKVAKQFEGVFLTEMLRMARPDDKAAKGFSTGESGGTWRVFMDQALGEAAANNGGTGLSKQIEAEMSGNHNPHGGKR